MKKLSIIGGGLAGCEAAWQAGIRGISVNLYEMRPHVKTGAHSTEDLAELVCSNSLGSNLAERAPGLLKEELRHLNSLLIRCADRSSLPAGSALAVDRGKFCELIVQELEKINGINIIRKEINTIPSNPTIIASGPLTSTQLADNIKHITGENNLFFYDAIAPIIYFDSIDMDTAFRASRYDHGKQAEGDYINCPFNKDQYYNFVQELINADRAELRSFEKEITCGVKAGSSPFFESCLPVEIIAERGIDALAFGPMRPVGLTDPHTGKRPFAVVQLRQDNLAGNLYNMVGFQTNLTLSSQKKVFRLIPGMNNAEFIRFGQMHRNTYIESPALINKYLQFIRRPDLFFAGQITGVEGYVGSIATGLIAGINSARIIQNGSLIKIPDCTMVGSLCRYISNEQIKDFQPMKPNFGIMPPIPSKIHGKRERAKYHAGRSISGLKSFIASEDFTWHSTGE